MTNILHMANPAPCWENATPVGNGSMGLMLFGGTDCEQLYLNEESIWSGNGSTGRSPGFRDKIEQVRRLFLDGKPVEADAWAEEHMNGDFSRIGSYETAGVLTLDFADKTPAKDYRRDLRLQEGTAFAGVLSAKSSVSTPAVS